MITILAYPVIKKKNYYWLVGEKHNSDTYQIKDYIKQIGGKWDSELKHWVIDKFQLQQLKDLKVAIIYEMFKVKIEPYCCEKNSIEIMVNEKELEKGYAILGCGYCDTSFRDGKKVKILHVVE